MLFEFLKYIRPVWYYHISDSNTFLVDYSCLTEDVISQINLEVKYEAESSVKIDAAYQLFYAGYIPSEKDRSLDFFYEENLNDNYRFTRKYFSSFWSWYVLFYRLITFHNPILEISSFLKSSKVKFQELYTNQFNYDVLKQPLSTNEQVTVILPTLNRYDCLNDLLSDLQNQDYPIHELIIIDQSDKIDKEFYSNFSSLPIYLIQKKQRGQWFSRNLGIEESTGNWILLLDDDSRVPKGWISSHLKSVNYFNTEVSTGASLYLNESKNHEFNYYYHMSEDFDSGNALVKRTVFAEVGFFDMQFELERKGDQEFGARLIKSGKKLVFSPDAKRRHLYSEKGGLRTFGNWDGFKPGSIFKPNPYPSVVYFYERYYPQSALNGFMVLGIITNRGRGIFTVLTTLLLSPLLLISFLRAKKLGGKKRAEGAKI